MRVVMLPDGETPRETDTNLGSIKVLALLQSSEILKTWLCGLANKEDYKDDVQLRL